MFYDTGASQARAQAVATRRDPRERLLQATIETVALRGYERTTVSRILSVAELDDAVFEEHFHDKRDCFWQALDELFGRGERATLELFGLKLPWAQRVALGIERLLAALAAEPAHARVLLVETLGAGAEACERRRVALALLGSLMEHGRAQSADAAQLPAQTSEAIVGGVVSILHRRALQGETDELPLLRADLTYFALLPYLDHERALAVANRQPVV